MVSLSLRFPCTGPHTRTCSESVYTLPPHICCFSRAGSSWSFGLFLRSGKADLAASSLRFFNFCPCHLAPSLSDLTCHPFFPVNTYPSLSLGSIIMSPSLTPSQCDDPTYSLKEVLLYLQASPTRLSSFPFFLLTNMTYGSC